MYTSESFYTCTIILAYTLPPKRGLWNDADFASFYVAQVVICSSYERIFFAKVMPKPAHEDRNADRDRACPHHHSDY